MTKRTFIRSAARMPAYCPSCGTGSGGAQSLMDERGRRGFRCDCGHEFHYERPSRTVADRLSDIFGQTIGDSIALDA
jgi:hypothetical protein